MNINLKNRLVKTLSLLLVLFMFLSCNVTNVFAAETPRAVNNGDNSITFSNVEKMSVGEYLEMDIVDEDGNPATVSIERVIGKTAERASSRTWKVSYTGVVINCYFYMTVSNNKVTSVYDDWILIIGGTYDNESLSKTSTYGKLKFKLDAYAGIMSATCWLKGTVTGSDNDITVSYQM